MKKYIASAIMFAIMAILSLWSIYNLQLPIAIPFITGLISLSMLALYLQIIENKLKQK